jgi:DHA2 family lincomycin resistance protein-like MFS transporter
MSLFSAGTLVAALAPGFGTLVAGRVIQASGTAIMLPLLMTTVMTLVPAASRGRTMGNIYDRHLGGPRRRPTAGGCHPQRPGLALDVLARPAHRAGLPHPWAPPR